MCNAADRARPEFFGSSISLELAIFIKRRGHLINSRFSGVICAAESLGTVLTVSHGCKNH
jgi:hypothetical protein